MVYGYVFPGPEGVVDLTTSEHTKGTQKAFHLDILYICQMIHTEAISFLYRHCVFRLRIQDLVPVSCLWGCHNPCSCDRRHKFESFWKHDPLSAEVYALRNRNVYYNRQLHGLTSPDVFSRLANLEIAVTLDMKDPFWDDGGCPYDEEELSECGKNVLVEYMHHFKLPMAHLNRLLRRFSNLVYLCFRITLDFCLPALWCAHNCCRDPDCDGWCWRTEEEVKDCGCGQNDATRAKLQRDGLQVLKEQGFFKEWHSFSEDCENVDIECYVAEKGHNILHETFHSSQRRVDKEDEHSFVEVRIIPFPSELTSSTNSISQMVSSSDDDLEVIPENYEPPRQLCGHEGHTPEPSCFCCCHCHCECDDEDDEEDYHLARYCRCNSTKHEYGDPELCGQKEFYTFYRHVRYQHTYGYCDSLYCMPNDAESLVFDSAPCACWEANSHIHCWAERHDWENCQCDCHDDFRFKISWRDVVNEQLLHIDDFFPRLPNPNVKKQAFVEYDFGDSEEEDDDSDYFDTFSLTSDKSTITEHDSRGGPGILYSKASQIPKATKQALLEVKNGVVCISKETFPGH